MSAPARVVTYLLDRMQSNADLYYEIGWGTQAFRLLCEAEAEATSVPVADVMRKRQPCFDPRPPRHEEIRKLRLEASQ